MWLHAPRAAGDTASSFALAHEFSLWMLVSGKPTSVPTSEINWSKSGWLHALDLWESPELQAARVRAHCAELVADRSKLRVLALCSGYGGLELGVDAALGGARVVCHVERQAYAAATLAARMREGVIDEAPIWSDLETFDCAPWRGLVDVVIGGFPCQGASVAGKRLGVEDERWLWPEVWKIVQETQARWAFLENVPGLLSVNGGRAFAQVLGDLGARGWHAEWDCVPAGAVGAPHLRDRLFLLAADAERVAVRVEPERHQRRRRRARAAERGPAELGDGRARGPVADARQLGPQADQRALVGYVRAPQRHDTVAHTAGRDQPADDAAVADNASQQSSERARRARDERPGDDTRGGGLEAPADAEGERRDEGRALDPGARREGGSDLARGDQPPAGPRDPADPDDAGRARLGDGGQLDGGLGAQRGRDVDRRRGRDVDRRRGPEAGHAIGDIGGIIDAGRAHWDWRRSPEPCVRQLDDGSAGGLDDDPSYADQLHLLGNGVVWQAAAVAFLILWERLHGPRSALADPRRADVADHSDHAAEHGGHAR